MTFSIKPTIFFGLKERIMKNENQTPRDWPILSMAGWLVFPILSPRFHFIDTCRPFEIVSTPLPSLWPTNNNAKHLSRFDNKIVKPRFKTANLGAKVCPNIFQISEKWVHQFWLAHLKWTENSRADSEEYPFENMKIIPIIFEK